MIEPSLALRTAVRSALIADPAVTALVETKSIRAGSTRPDQTPCIILGGENTEYLGAASGDQRIARISLDLHVWAIEDGPDTAKAVGFAVFNALVNLRETAAEGIWIDEFEQPNVVWLRDVQPELSYVHGVMDLEAIVRWQA